MKIVRKAPSETFRIITEIAKTGRYNRRKVGRMMICPEFLEEVGSAFEAAGWPFIKWTGGVRVDHFDIPHQTIHVYEKTLRRWFYDTVLEYFFSATIEVHEVMAVIADHEVVFNLVGPGNKPKSYIRHFYIIKYFLNFS
ncbi:MAG: hypothetical protein FWC68_00035 [Oscillospiraceae bacterium]|nr:hypothetical protein [Oscillospiraceae bacterium]